MRVRAALIAGLAALAAAAPASADTWTVTDGSSDSTAACNTGTHRCVSLRAAIAASEATKEVPDTINVPAGTISINNDVVIQSDITVLGSSARTNIIDGGGKYRGFRVTASGNASISRFTVRDGAAGGGGIDVGGGILNAGVSVLDNVRVTASVGGGIVNLAGGRMAIRLGLIDGNTGGGIVSQGGPEPTPVTFVQIMDTTIFGNTGATGQPGGVANLQRGLASILRSTIADNVGGARATVGGMSQQVAETVAIAGSIVARNRSSSGTTANCLGTVRPTDGGSNVEDNDTCGFDLTADPRLDTKLSNAGGDVDVLALASGSPAIDRLPVSASTCAAGTFDQRGLYRPQGTRCDSGAYELDQAATMTITGGPAGTVSSSNVEFTFSSSEPGITPVCRLTGPGQTGAYVACYKVNAQPYTGLANGVYSFSVRDGAFPNSTAASRTFTVEALDTTITGGPDGPTNDSTPTWTFTGAGGAAGFECSVDGATFVGCSSPHTSAALAEGAHTFAVRALSVSGAPDPTPATRTFTVDVTPPAPPQVVSGPEGPTTQTSPAFEFAASETVSCRLDGPGAAVGEFGACASPKRFGGLAPGDYVFVVRSVDAAGNATETRRAFTVTAPQGAQPTPTPTPTATPEPTPSAQSVVVAPATGTVLVRLPGSRTFSALDASQGIPFGSEVDAREGRVRLTALPTAGKPPETAEFFDGLFTIHKVGGFIELRLSEKLTGCPKAKKSASAAQKKKPKSRKLWGDGKGKFRTRGQYSAATVRGTRWLVQDTCTTTLTRVTQGVVGVRDFVKRTNVLVKKGKRYTARAKRR